MKNSTQLDTTPFDLAPTDPNPLKRTIPEDAELMTFTQIVDYEGAQIRAIVKKSDIARYESWGWEI